MCERVGSGGTLQPFGGRGVEGRILNGIVRRSEFYVKST